MTGNRWVIILALIAVLSGCASIFGRSTDDPSVKLTWASEYFNSLEEPVKAEELIWEAIEIYKENRNDLGLAEAYRQYGLFLRSNSVQKHLDYFREEGFRDQAVTEKTRYARAVDYFNKSKDLYADFGHIEKVSNIHISIAKTYDLMNMRTEACEAFSRGLEDYALFKQANPEARDLRSEEMANYEEYIGILKKQAGCAQ